MKSTIKIIMLASLLGLIGCADFPEKYENVIEGEKIRPFAIIVEPPEAAPGDTVRVSLKMYDAGKNYNVEWELALKYQIDNYDALPNITEIVDLESGSQKINATSDGLEFSVVIPAGDKNPILLSNLAPDVLRSKEELSGKEKESLEKLGLTDLSKDLRKEDVVEVFAVNSSIPNELSTLVDNLVALVQFKAKVTSPGFKLNVTKNLTIRYSNRLETGYYLSNVNRNPTLDSIGIIRVHAKGVTDIEDITKHESDTVYLKTGSYNNTPTPAFDTVRIKEDYSYFAFAASEGTEQKYRSPAEKEHSEVIFYDWFYTNLDDVETEWEDLITFNTDDSPSELPIVALNLPKNKSMQHFILRATAMDWRVEWGALTSRGIDHKVVYGYFDYVE